MSEIILDAGAEVKAEGRGTLADAKFGGWEVAGGYDPAQRWKLAGARNVKKPDGSWVAWARNVEVLRAMAKVRGPIALDAAASALYRSKAKSVDGSRAADLDVSLPCPDGLSYLGYQKAGISYALQHDGTLIGDEMGLGKTIQALGIINADPEIKSVLCIIPASLRLNWLREATKWLLRPMTYWIAGVSEGPSEDGNFVIINFDRLKKHPELMNRKFDLIVVDEAHKIKNPKAQRTKAILGYWDKPTKAVVAGLIANCRRKVLMTGTPLLNRPEELWPICNALAPTVFRSWKTFMLRYCNAQQVHIGGGKYAWKTNGASNLEELQVKLRENFMVRRLKSEVLKELPAKRRQIVVLPTNGAARFVEQEARAWSRHADRLADLEAEAELAHASGNESEYQKILNKLQEAAKIAFTEISSQRHEVALAKVPACVEHIEEVLEEEDKVVVFAHHKDVVAKLKKGLENFSPVVVTGDTSIQARQEAVDDFMMNDKVRVIILTIAAGGVGFTLTKARVAIFCELDWVPGNVSQAEDRIHRIGQLDSVLIQHLVLDGSLDVTLAETIVEKQKIADSALDVLAEVKIPAIPVRRGPPRPPKYAETSVDDRNAVHAGLRMLDALCDGVRAEDHMGFSAVTRKAGHSLALNGISSDGQAWLAAKIVTIHRGQIGGDSSPFVVAAKRIMDLNAAKSAAK